MAQLTWTLVNDTAEALGAKAPRRRKWRQRGVPAQWRIRIVQDLMAKGIAISLADFDGLETTQGMAA